MKIHHTGIYVIDLEGAKTFFTKYFNFTAGDKYHNPRTGFSSYMLNADGDGSRLELMTRGEVVFEERQDIRDAIIEKSAIVNALYSTMRDNPIFKVFYLKNIDGWVTNLGHVKGLNDKAEFAKPVHFEF